jgi:hypothetical protein
MPPHVGKTAVASPDCWKGEAGGIKIESIVKGWLRINLSHLGGPMPLEDPGSVSRWIDGLKAGDWDAAQPFREGATSFGWEPWRPPLLEGWLWPG